MKLYLAGPMRGIPLFNFPAFSEATQNLRALGHEVWSPAEHDVTKDGFNPSTDQPRGMAHYMERDLPEVCRADAVAVLPGWRDSVGARLEVTVAQACGIPILNAWTLAPVTETVLQEAERLTSSDRNKHYGHPRDNFTNTAAMWTAYLRGARKLRDGEEITGRDFGWMQTLCKAARDANLPKRDNLTDGCGYLRCVERLDEPRPD